MELAERNCWTCKKHKTGCDKNLPVCQNCCRTGRQCLGYGLRLSWGPRGPNDRYRRTHHTHRVPSSQSSTPEDYGGFFINYTYQDFTYEKHIPAYISLCKELSPRPSRALLLHAPFDHDDAVYVDYYKQKIAPMVSTTKLRNGFVTEILPMIFSDRSTTFSALRSAVMAIAAFHRSDIQIAERYKLHALRQLSQSISTSSPLTSMSAVNTSLATIMMLCMFSVFDRDDGTWHIHLAGSQRLLQQFRSNNKRSQVSKFLVMWYLYYDVLAQFSRPSGNSSFVWSMAELDFETDHIVGFIGCSLEVWRAVNDINHLRSKCNTVSRTSIIEAQFRTARFDLERKLNSLTQNIDKSTAYSTPLARNHASITADLYRLAALLYLLRVYPLGTDTVSRRSYLRQAYDLLGSLTIASSPWPIYVIACEAEDEAERKIILQTLDVMVNQRNVGNILVIRHLVEMIWKQNDLQTQSCTEEQIQWWNLDLSDASVPWFA